MAILEVLVALLISCALVAQISSSAAGFGKFLRENHERHRRSLEDRSLVGKYQSSLNITGDLLPPAPTESCQLTSPGESFDELTCSTSGGQTFRLLAPRGFLLIEVLAWIVLTALVLSSLPAIIRSATHMLGSGEEFEDRVAKELLLSSLLHSQIMRAAAIPGIQTLRIHPPGTILDPSGDPMPVSSNILNRPAPGFNPISFLIPDLSFVLTPATPGLYCLQYRTGILEQRTAVSSISRYLIVSLRGVTLLSGKAVSTPSTPLCITGTFTIQNTTPSASSSIYPLNSDHSAALFLLPIRDEFTVYLANSGAFRRMSNLTTENQPIINQSPFAIVGSIHEEDALLFKFGFEVVSVEADPVWQPLKMTAATSKTSPVASIDLMR
jgi:hypothetical protein